mmetsp:Transcript_45766/g.115703  ORF Transcript_45766/g.115703 Transcript_45766/m.115703 type:complete len:213 (+) Transcript_45766:467-1105(+)
MLRVNWLPEARPACAGFKLGTGGEQRETTNGADIGTALLIVVAISVHSGPREGGLRRSVECHTSLEKGELLGGLLALGQRHGGDVRSRARHLPPHRRAPRCEAPIQMRDQYGGTPSRHHSPMLRIARSRAKQVMRRTRPFSLNHASSKAEESRAVYLLRTARAHLETAATRRCPLSLSRPSRADPIPRGGLRGCRVERGGLDGYSWARPSAC